MWRVRKKSCPRKLPDALQKNIYGLSLVKGRDKSYSPSWLISSLHTNWKRAVALYKKEQEPIDRNMHLGRISPLCAFEHLPVDTLYIYYGASICHVFFIIHLTITPMAYHHYAVSMKTTSFEKVIQTARNNYLEIHHLWSETSSFKHQSKKLK